MTNGTSNWNELDTNKFWCILSHWLSVLWTRWVSQKKHLSAEVIWQMVQRHFKVLADYALSFPRLVEPNPSCEPFGMWDGYSNYKRFDFSFSTKWLKPLTLAVRERSAIAGIKHPTKRFTSVPIPAGVCTEKLTWANPVQNGTSHF